MGYLDRDMQIQDLETLKEQLTVYPENDYMRGLVYTLPRNGRRRNKYGSMRVWEYESVH